jgi:hypothetical protein
MSSPISHTFFLGLRVMSRSAVDPIMSLKLHVEKEVSILEPTRRVEDERHT